MEVGVDANCSGVLYCWLLPSTVKGTEGVWGVGGCQEERWLSPSNPLVVTRLEFYHFAAMMSMTRRLGVTHWYILIISNCMETAL